MGRSAPVGPTVSPGLHTSRHPELDIGSPADPLTLVEHPAEFLAKNDLAQTVRIVVQAHPPVIRRHLVPQLRYPASAMTAGVGPSAYSAYDQCRNEDGKCQLVTVHLFRQKLNNALHELLSTVAILRASSVTQKDKHFLGRPITEMRIDVADGRRFLQAGVSVCAPELRHYQVPTGKPAAGRHPPHVRRIADVVSGNASSQTLDRRSGSIGHFLKFRKNLRETLRKISNNAGVLQQPAEIPRGHHQIQMVRSIALLDKPVFLIEFG
jgi:hypothetical protein